MIIELDPNPSNSKNKNNYFISVKLNKKEWLSFDNTTKGHRIMKQVLKEIKEMPKGKKIDGKWEVLIIKNRKLIRKYKAKWIDLDKLDWVNNEIWETTKVKKISKTLSDKLLYYSRLVSDHYKELHKYNKELIELEALLKKEICRWF
ncbi:MAG: hypothetical protein PHH82_02520 [Candidatus ainarchaeum sp.]|nr:hypothetical protein [Candidatus ainarchaeum sp.]